MENIARLLGTREDFHYTVKEEGAGTLSTCQRPEVDTPRICVVNLKAYESLQENGAGR
jgi:hypothetical protein